MGPEPRLARIFNFSSKIGLDFAPTQSNCYVAKGRMKRPPLPRRRQGHCGVVLVAANAVESIGESRDKTIQ